jgi:hypothetical protein
MEGIMSEQAHHTEAPGEAVLYPAYVAEFDRATHPAPARVVIGDELVNVDWFQVLAAGFAGGAAGVTPGEREALVIGLRARVEALGAAACLGPFVAEEEAAGALLVALLQYAAARGFSLWAATDRALTELAIAEGARLLGARA